MKTAVDLIKEIINEEMGGVINSPKVDVMAKKIASRLGMTDVVAFDLKEKEKSKFFNPMKLNEGETSNNQIARRLNMIIVCDLYGELNKEQLLDKMLEVNGLEKTDADKNYILTRMYEITK